MSIAGLPLQGFGQMAGQITGDESFQNVARDVAQFASTATQSGGIENAVFNQLPNALGFDQTTQQLGQFVHALVSGQPIDPSAVTRLIDDSGVLGDFSTQQGVSAFENFSAGNIGPGIQDAANLFGVEVPSIGGFNPLSLIG